MNSCCASSTVISSEQKSGEVSPVPARASHDCSPPSCLCSPHSRSAAAPLQEQLGHEDAHAHRLGGERKPVAARGHKNRRQTLVVVMTGGYCRGLHVAGRWA